MGREICFRGPGARYAFQPQESTGIRDLTALGLHLVLHLGLLSLLPSVHLLGSLLCGRPRFASLLKQLHHVKGTSEKKD